MSGYYQNKMSNNAVIAYANGERPMSKWSKKAIMEEIEQLVDWEDLPAEILPVLSKMTLPALKDLLHETGLHHTSYMYNKTYFYEVDADYILFKLYVNHISIPNFVNPYDD